MKKTAKELVEVEPVVLKSFFGVRAGYWIMGLGILIILLAFFLLLLLPGIVTKKAYVRFNISLNNVAIYDDGRYLGSSNGSVYSVKNGVHTFSFYYGDIKLGEVTQIVRKNVFASLFYRKINDIDFDIIPDSELKNQVVENFAKNVASFSKVIDFDYSYPAPPLFSSFAEDCVNLGIDEISDIWLYGASHITSQAFFENYKKGLEILDNSEISCSSDTLERLWPLVEEMFSNEKTEIAGFKAEKKVAPVKNGSFYTYPEGRISMGTSITMGYPEVNFYPMLLSVPSFSIGEKLVSEYEYALFVEENPEWSLSNIDQLIAEGLVDSNYLKNMLINSRLNRTNVPIRSVSYYAALAYIDWLNGKDSAYIYSLPDEPEWQLAANSSNASYASSLNYSQYVENEPVGLRGQAWEYTSDSYIPLYRLIGYEESKRLENLFPYDGVIIKGGSYLNKPGDVTVNSVGVIDKNETSEFVSFRIVRNER